MTEILQRFAHAREVFGELTEAELSKFTYRKLRAGDYLIREGEQAATAFYFILSGICVGEAKIAGCADAIPAQYVRGDFVGLRELLYNPPLPRSFSIRCKTSVEVIELHRSEMDNLVRNHPHMPFTIMRGELTNLFKARDVLANCTSRKTNFAVAYYLGHLYDIYSTLQPAGYTGAVRIIDTHKELCSTLGCSKRTVDRYIAEFAENGMVTLKRGKIHIDAAQRERIAAYIG